MTLEEDNAALRVENALLKAQNATLVARISALEAKLGLDSQNSSKPPSSDTPPPRTPPRGQRTPSGCARRCYPAWRPAANSCPDARFARPVFCPACCADCGHPLADVPVMTTQRRQVFDVPEVRVMVTEHQVLTKECGCGQSTTAVFPPDVRSLTQYGVRLRATALYLITAQFVPYARRHATVSAASGKTVSDVAATDRRCSANTGSDTNRLTNEPIQI